MDMKTKHLRYCYIILAVFIILISSLMLSSCKNDDEKLYQDVTIEVYHPITNEVVPYRVFGEVFEFEYDGNPKVFTARVKLNSTGKFLENKDFENNDWKSYIKLRICYGDDTAYKDWREVDGERIVLDWQNENDWPTERGIYRIILAFNDFGLFDEIESNSKYIRTWFYLTIKIV